MKLRTLFCATLVCLPALVASQGQSKSVPTTAASDIPHLRKQGTATQLIVDFGARENLPASAFQK
jgi:hypothetical protein